MRITPFLLAGALAALGGCGKSSTGPNGPPSSSGPFTAIVDGTAFSASTATATYLNNAFTITGSAVQGGVMKAISISVPDAHVAGVYGLTIAGASATYSETSSGTSLGWLCAITMGSGQITFTLLNATHVKATFYFTAPANTISGATGTRTITSGTIDIVPTNPS